jgi:hypothetical protein
VQPPPPGLPSKWGHFSYPPEKVGPAYIGPPSPENHGQLQSLPGYGTPTAGYSQQPAYSPPAPPSPLSPLSPLSPVGSPLPWSGYGNHAPAPTSQQTIGRITFAIIGLLGLLGAVLTLTLWINLNNAASRASYMCTRYSGEYLRVCQQSIEKMVPSVPVALVICLFLMIAASLAASGGAVMLFLRRPMGQFLLLGGGIVMLVLSIGCEARYGSTSRVTYDLIAGLVFTVAASLMFVPAFRVLFGLPPNLTDRPEPRAFAGGGPWPYGQPPPQQQGPFGPGRFPPQL